MINLNWLPYVITPVVGAVIGYFTNWLAIKMLFRPHREKRIAGIRLPFTPGLIPKERERLTAKVSETVSAFVLTPDMLAKELASAGIWRELSDLTLGEILMKVGVEDPAVYAEKLLMTALGDEKVKHALGSAAADRLTAYLRGEGGEAGITLIENGLTALRKSLFAEGVTVGDRIPEPVTEMIIKAAGEVLPKAVGYIKQWPAEYPWLDEKLEAMVRKIIDDNFGRLIGIFIDHKKIYANIRDGLFEYLSDPENQRFITSRLSEAVERLRSAELAHFEARLPDDAYFTGAFMQWAQNGGAEQAGEVLQTMLNGVLDAGLPEPVRELLRRVSRSVCAVKPAQLADWFAAPEKSGEKKAAEAGDTRLLRAFQQMAAYIAKHMRIREMIEDKLNAFSVEEAESLILSVVNRELQSITVLGGVLGFIIGLLSLLPQVLMQ